MSIIKVIGKILLILIILVAIVIITGLLFLRFYPAIGEMPGAEQRKQFAEQTDLYYDNQFHNENEIPLINGEGYPSSSRRKPAEIIKAETPDFLTELSENDLTYTWIGHSSFLLQFGTKNILVDPVFSDTASPVSFAGPKRFSELPLTIDELPEIDVLLLSHDHYDHMDYETIKNISSKVGLFVVPLGLDSILKGWGVDGERIVALDWWENTEVDGLTITLTPSQHYTGRNPLKRSSTYWGGYYMDNGIHKVYYTGDGGYYDVFERIREKLGAPDLMIAECGQYDPAWAWIHMFPEQTVQATIDTGAEWVIPVHWGTFCICNHAWDDSIIRFTTGASENGLNVATPKIGQTVSYDNIDTFNEKWWEEYE